jgi:hypothetical protein
MWKPVELYADVHFFSYKYFKIGGEWKRMVAARRIVVGDIVILGGEWKRMLLSLFDVSWCIKHGFVHFWLTLCVLTIGVAFNSNNAIMFDAFSVICCVYHPKLEI